MAVGSKAALAPVNCQLARAAMMGFRSDGGKLLGVTPTVLVVPPALEADARYLLATDIQPAGGSNPWKSSCDLIVTPYLS